MKVIMNMYQSIGTASDRVIVALIAGLELEFGPGAGQALAHRFLEAEEVDFRWDARVEERWISAYESTEGEDFGFDGIAICGRFDGKWFCATMLVDGDGQAHGMMDAASSVRWSGRRMRCSMRTECGRFGGERRRRHGVVSPPVLNREGWIEGREGKQDKGSVSQHCISLCLHIIFSGDSESSSRDNLSGRGGNPPFLARNRETPGHFDA